MRRTVIPSWEEHGDPKQFSGSQESRAKTRSTCYIHYSLKLRNIREAVISTPSSPVPTTHISLPLLLKGSFQETIYQRLPTWLTIRLAVLVAVIRSGGRGHIRVRLRITPVRSVMVVMVVEMRRRAGEPRLGIRRLYLGVCGFLLGLAGFALGSVGFALGPGPSL